MTEQPPTELPEGAPDAVPVADLEREADIAADYIEGFLDVLDLAGDIDMDVEGVRPTVSVVADPAEPHALDSLVGKDGAVLEALQELTRLAVSQGTRAPEKGHQPVIERRAARGGQNGVI